MLFIHELSKDVYLYFPVLKVINMLHISYLVCEYIGSVLQQPLSCDVLLARRDFRLPKQWIFDFLARSSELPCYDDGCHFLVFVGCTEFCLGQLWDIPSTAYCWKNKGLYLLDCDSFFSNLCLFIGVRFMLLALLCLHRLQVCFDLFWCNNIWRSWSIRCWYCGVEPFWTLPCGLLRTLPGGRLHLDMRRLWLFVGLFIWLVTRVSVILFLLPTAYRLSNDFILHFGAVLLSARWWLIFR